MIRLLEFAELADKKVEAYKIGMQALTDGKVAMEAVGTEPDGMGLADRVPETDPEGEDLGANQFPLCVPRSRREPGRPTNKRPQAPHEGCSKRPRHCIICRSEKDNRLKCPAGMSPLRQNVMLAHAQFVGYKVTGRTHVGRRAFSWHLLCKSLSERVCIWTMAHDLL